MLLRRARDGLRGRAGREVTRGTNASRPGRVRGCRLVPNGIRPGGVGLGLAVILLSTLAACAPSGGQAGATSVATASESSTGAVPAYLAEVDSNGLIDGRTPAQIGGDVAFACMQDKGWSNLVLDPDGSFGGDVPPEQSAKYDGDLEGCFAEAADQYPTVAMSDRAIRERFALEVATRSCLMAKGYQIDEPPSQDTWVSQFATASADIWLPYAQVYARNSIGQTAQAALKVACPDPADRFYLP